MDSRNICLAPMKMWGSASFVWAIALAGRINPWDDLGSLNLNWGGFQP
jgi:hypothetical protein